MAQKPCKVAVLALLVCVGGCESEAEKLRRLETEATISYLRFARHERERDSLFARMEREGQVPHDSVRSRWADSIAVLRRRATIAERDLARFLR